MKLSVVIPVHNEEGNVAALHRELVKACRAVTTAYELIFVNDCSSDRTLEYLRKLRPVTVLSFGRNTGQAAALKAGFDYASGDVIVSIDGDLQNDPADIPRLVALLQKYDVVCGWRKKRRDFFLTTFVSRIGYRLRQFLIRDGVHDSGCTLKAYRKEFVKDLEIFGQLHRYIPALLKLRGARMCEVVVNHRARHSGTSKYNLLKVIPGFLDLLLVWFWQKYSARPVHLLGVLSLVVMAFGMLTGLWAAWLKWGPRHIDLSNTFLPNVAVFSFMIGVQLLITSLLADIMIKNYYRNVPVYHVREIVKRT